MREKFLKRRLALLQYIADFIYIMLELNIENEKAFDYWMWKGLSLDYWCKERGIYLN
jgi:hypothetical protein